MYNIKLPEMGDGGNRPQRGFIERLLSYLYYLYGVLKRNQDFLKVEN